MAESSMVIIVKALINASEKAASIARSCSSFGSEALAVAEKCDGEANARFDKDFKTIADVLAQVSAKYEIEMHCEGLGSNVRGEECSTIGGVTIELKETEEMTAELLSKLVSPNAAKRLANAAHREVNLQIGDIVPSGFPDVNPSDIGVWIDPIDATAEFIAGVNGQANADGGLGCVTVLIGAYLKSTGEPIFGVINHAFFENDESSLGRIVWGLCHAGFRKWGVSEEPKNYFPKCTIFYISATEQPEVVEKIKELGWTPWMLPGAGHKFMKIALRQAAGYILSKGTTFRWDTCGPQAILRARGGDILSYTTMLPLTYNDRGNQEPNAYCNSGGLIAYSDVKVIEKLKVGFNTD